VVVSLLTAFIALPTLMPLSVLNACVKVLLDQQFSDKFRELL
jgi:hypothetical protein